MEKNRLNYFNKICIINCFDTYEHRVDLLYDFFKRNGSEVSVYTSDFKHFDKCQRNDKKKDFRYFHAIPYTKNISMTRLWSHMVLAKNIFGEVNKYDYDVVWVIIPPNSFTKEAVTYKKNHRKTKLIFDLLDLWPETMPISKFKSLPPFLFWKNLRDKYLDMADEIVTECKLYQQKLPNNIKDKLHTIYLAREVKEYHPKLNLPQDRISLCYLGSINNIIDISAIVSLIKNIKRYKNVELHIIGDGEKRNDLILNCEKAGANVIYHGKVYNPVEKQSIFDSCHYGLNYMKKSVLVGLTMKSIDYFEAGIPIINNIYGDTWNFLETNKLGYNISEQTDYREIVNYDYECRSVVRDFFVTMFSVETFENNIKALFAEKKQ